MAKALRGLTFDAIYCSPLQRAKETALMIHSCLEDSPEPQVDQQLMEIDLPFWAGMLRQEVKNQFPEAYNCWQNTPDQLGMEISTEAGEKQTYFPVLSIFESAQGFWEKILPRHPDQTILIVGHNGINRALIGTAIGIPPAFYHGIQQSNCGITVLNFAGVLGESVQLESMNLTSHVGECFPNTREGHQGVRILFVRHGETEWNRQQKFQGQIDVPLNENGQEQSRKAAEFLKETQIDFAVSSPMLRPKETAEIILQYHPHISLQLDSGLCEISHGLWEGKYEHEIEKNFPGMLEQWKTTPEVVQMPEGENLQQVWERAIETWRSIIANAQPGTVGLVVAHDAINKAILCHLFGLKPEHFWKFKQGNGAVTVIDYPKGLEGFPVLQAMNITTHLSGSILDKTAAGAL